MAKNNNSTALFDYAILYHPNPTKEQREAGEEPKSELVVLSTGVLAKDKEQVAMLAARSLPEKYVDKLDDIEILVRPF